MNHSQTSPSRLDQLDQQLLNTLAERVAEYGRQDRDAASMPSILDIGSAAELEAFAKVDAASLQAWLRHGASICRRASGQRSPISYLGPIYSYSYLAAAEYFGLAAEFVPVANIAAAFDELVRGQAKFGVVPIENSTDGRVVDTLGMFAKTPVQICGEVLLPIHHCLMGRCPRQEIREVHSKPQALSQCRNWLAAHLPNASLVEVGSTATAAVSAGQQPGVAAIASREAGLHNGLDIIDANIEDNQGNVTRFAVIGNVEPPPTHRDKTSLMFQLHHRPGALAAAMQVFQVAGLNLTWIESFPLPNCPNEYLFFVELDGHQATAGVGAAIADLRKLSLRLEVLGSYPKGKMAV